jgi:hypothetical protein
MSPVLCLVLALVGLAGSQTPGTGEPPSAPTVKGADLQLLEDVRGVAERLEGLRGVEFDRAPIAVRASEEARRAAADHRVSVAIVHEDLDARGRAWDDVGLARPGAPARLYSMLAQDLDGVSFDPEGRRLLVDPARLTDADFSSDEGDEDDVTSLILATGVRPDEPSIIHMLVHLLQSERLGWSRLPGTTDALLARAAWAEGEANVAALRYLFQPMGLQDEVLARGLEPESVLGGRLHPVGLDPMSGPETVLALWAFREGFAQAAARFQAGGWEAVEESMRTRGTTRDLMHLDRAPLRPSPGAPVDPGLPDGYRLADRDVLGEQSIVVLVSFWTAKDNLGLVAGDGWRGDELFRWEKEGSPDGVTVWVTRWESDQAAIDFEYAYARALEARFPGEKPAGGGDGRLRVESEDRVVRVAREGREVRVDVRPPALAPAENEKSPPLPSPESGDSGN